MVTFLVVLNAGANPDAEGNRYLNAFHAAISNDQYDMARILLERGARVDDEGFIEAVYCYSSHPWFLDEILRTRSPDVNACRQGPHESALFLAVDRSDEAVRLLLARKPFLDFANDGGSVLCIAISRGRADLAAELVRLGADVHLGGKADYPFGLAVAQACKDGSLELMDLLLSKGVDISPAIIKA